MDRALTVAVHTGQLFPQYLPTNNPEVDYLSVFSTDESDYDRLNAQAQRVGEVVFEKNGPVYRLEAEGSAARLPTSIVRVREPGTSPELIGCADFTVASYEKARAYLAGNPHCREELKPGYRMIKITKPAALVTLYVPNQRLTKTLMGL